MRNIKYELNNGYPMPIIGFGTWQTPDGDVCVSSVAKAIETGFRLIDTAAGYRNEGSVGRGIKVSGIERGKLFVTTKLANSQRGYETTRKAFEQSLNELQLDYIDLYLIHWPASQSRFENWEEINLATWQAMTELYMSGKIKAIGVSNFWPHHLKALMETEVKPMVNQIEYHPGFLQTEVTSFCRANNILLEGYSPLGTGKVLDNPVLGEIAAAHGCSTAQVCIQWAMRNSIVPLPKSVTPSRIEQNFDVDSFYLTTEEIRRINELPFIGGGALHPDKINF